PLTNGRINNNASNNSVWGIYVHAGANGLEISGNSLDSNNGFEENSPNRAAISLNPCGNGTYPVKNVLIVGNRMTERRVTPQFRQTQAVYANQTVGVKMLNNYASGNALDTYYFETNSAPPASSLNTWDPEGYHAPDPMPILSGLYDHSTLMNMPVRVYFGVA